MADTLLPPESSPLSVRWTRDDCARLEQAGVLSGRYELVEGSINRMGQNMRHANVVRLCWRTLFGLFGDEFVVSQTSIDVRPEDNPTNEPMPDVIVLTRSADQFDNYPKPEEIRLLVEVSDTTLRYDLSTKAGLYARAGIKEYWVVSVQDRNVTVLRDPRDGHYQDVKTLAESEALAPLATPDSPILISQLFPAVTTGPGN